MATDWFTVVLALAVLVVPKQMGRGHISWNDTHGKHP
jgi:hypothetical protein